MPEPERATQKTPRPISLFHASCWLALILVVAKAGTFDPPWLANLPRRVVKIVAASWTDALFALGCGIVAEAVVRAVGRWRGLAAAVRVLFLALFALFAFYAVAAIGLNHYFNRPITFQVFGLIGNATAVRSSISERITLPIGIALVLAPVGFLALARLTRRKARVHAGLAMFLVVWILAGAALHRRIWKSPEITIWLSPHYEFLRTMTLTMAGRRPQFGQDFPREYLDEFRTFGGRGPAARADFFQVPPSVPRPRNVIIVVLESVGAQYFALYGSSFDAMPKLTAEAQHALVFDNIYAHASFTYCSFRTLNFSTYPGLPWHYALLPNQRPAPANLASKMRARGTRTAYINNGNLYWEDARWLLDQSQSFDFIADYEKVGCPPLTSWGTEDRCVYDTLIRWMDEQPGTPFFAICWTDQSHDPYQLSLGVPPIKFSVAQSAARFGHDLSAYLNIVRENDEHLARIFEALRARGLADDTLVVVTGDHGEAFGDLHKQRGHAWTVFEEEVRVPLLAWNPRLFPNGGRVSRVGGHIDVNATIADLLGLEPDPGWQGHSLFDPEKPNRAYFMAIAGGDVFGVRDGDWKYSYDVTRGEESLFQLSSDPTEQRNVVHAQPALAGELRRRVAAWVAFEDAFLWSREN